MHRQDHRSLTLVCLKPEIESFGIRVPLIPGISPEPDFGAIRAERWRLRRPSHRLLPPLGSEANAVAKNEVGAAPSRYSRARIWGAAKSRFFYRGTDVSNPSPSTGE
jgi:hypothetical protein